MPPISRLLHALGAGVFALLGLAALARPATALADLHVPGDFATIQAALDAASDGDRILVAPGVYPEALVVDDRALEIVGVAGAEATVVDAGGLDASVLRVLDTGGDSVLLEGLTLRGGVASPFPGGQPLFGFGGALQVAGGSVEARACHFLDSTAETSGGGVYAGPSSTVTLEHCVISGNSVGNTGGGVSGPASVLDSSVCDNQAGARGGGVAQVPRLERCLLAGNSAEIGGAGSWLLQGDDELPQLVDCLVRDNLAFLMGGGFDLVIDGLPLSSPVADLGRGHRFVENTAGLRGGGARVVLTGFPDELFLGRARVEGCVFVKNEAPEADGLDLRATLSSEFGAFGQSIDLDRCTFVGDSFRMEYHSPPSAPVRVRNLIVREPPVLPELITFGGLLDTSHNNVEGLLFGTESIDADPLFADLAALDLSLSPGSPCIDTGHPNSPLDPDGTRADMGAVPFHPWRDLGHALDGSTSPRLDGQGSLIAGAQGELLLLDGPPSTVAIPVLGLDQIAAPFKGGVMLPSPDIVPGMFPTDAEGALSIPFTWPDAVPSGTEYVLQFWIPEGGGPLGWSASNGLLAVTR